MTKSVDFSIWEVGHALLAGVRTHEHLPENIVRLLLDQAVFDADNDPEDAGQYAVLAARLIDAFKLRLTRA